MNRKQILLIDDEKPIAETIMAYAKKENFEMVCVYNGEVGLAEFKEKKFDLIIVDWMLPGVTGPEIIRQIRKESTLPILMISARGDEADIVMGLELGADDYITKPFSPREMMARIHALLRRSDGINELKEIENKVFKCGMLELDSAKKEVWKSGQKIDLTPNEFRIVEALCRAGGEAVSRDNLMVEALGYRDFMNDRTLDTHVKNIRRKIEDDSKNPQLIQTVREIGFRINC